LNSPFGPFCPVLCPELENVADLLDNADILLRLFDMLCSAKENLSFKLDLNQVIEPSSLNLLATVRSCLLLHYLGVISIVFSSDPQFSSDTKEHQ